MASYLTIDYNMPCYYKDLLIAKIRKYIQPWWSISYSATQITKNIYLADIASAFNKDKMKENGITHILCTVLGLDPTFPDDFIYKNIHTRDASDEEIIKYFDECCDFIDEAIKNDGKILIHCICGVSRSTSIVIAYLIKRYAMAYTEAYRKVKKLRPIIEPNKGFKTQLMVYQLRNSL